MQREKRIDVEDRAKIIFAIHLEGVCRPWDASIRSHYTHYNYVESRLEAL